MKTPEQRVQEALLASLPDIVESLKKEVKESITWQVKNDIAKHVSESVTEWFKDNMLEEIKTVLFAEKEGLMATIPLFAEKITEEFTNNLMSHMKKKFESSYERSRILETLFK